MSNSKKQSFLFGAIILVSANMIVKLIGFIYKIPLYNFMSTVGGDGGGNGGVGMAAVNAAYQIYVWFFSISTTGLPVAISNMISVANSQKNYKEEKRIFKLSLIIFIILGTAGTAIMLLGARGFAGAMKNPDAYYSILVIAPTLFFICITSAYRGFFQGRQNMIPTAVSEIIESSGKLGVGLIATVYAINRGYDLPVVAAYAVSGLTVGVAFGALFMIITKKLIKLEEDNILEPMQTERMSVRSNKTIAKEIIKISLPIMLSSSFVSLSGLVDTFLMQRRLIDIGYIFEGAESVAKAAADAYGNYSTMAISFFNLPNSLVIPFAVSIIPVISAAYAQKNMESIRATIESTFRMVSIIAMPSAFGIAAMSGPILNLMFDDKDAVARTAPMLSILAIAIVFVALVSVTNSMLQAQRQENKTIISMALGSAVKLVGSYILIGIPALGRFGTPISTCLCYLTIVMINFYFLSKTTSVIPAVKKTFFKPFIASAVTGLSAVLSYRAASIFIYEKIATLVAIVLAVVIYVVMLFALKTLTKADVLLLPKGTKIYAALKKYNLIGG